MGSPVRNVTWQISVLTPLHIGTGTELVKGFDFTVVGNETVVLDVDRVWEAALSPPEEGGDFNLQLLRRPPAELVRPEDLRPGSDLVRYRMPGRPVGDRIREQIKDAFDRPYIPGSSLKGAVRTALLWAMVKEGAVEVRLDRLEKKREQAARPVERAAFGPDPNHDLLRALRIGDSTPVRTDPPLLLLNAYAFSAKGANIPINVEAIPNDAVVEVKVTFEEYLFTPEAEQELSFGRWRQWIMEDLPAILRRWADARLQEEIAFCQARGWARPLGLYRQLLDYLPRLRAGTFLIQVGWGTGWAGKTVGPALDAEMRDDLVERYRLSREKRRRGDPFPISRRMEGSRRRGETPLRPLGWLLVEVK